MSPVDDFTWSNAAVIVEALRSGIVPARGLSLFAVGAEEPLHEINRQLDLVEQGAGAFKFIRGDFGCGKTFTARLALEAAKAREFATSFVVISDADLQLHNLHDIYRRVVQELAYSQMDRGGLPQFFTVWRGNVRARLRAQGIEPTDPPTLEAFKAEINAAADRTIPADMARALCAAATAEATGNPELADAILSWTSGSESVGAAARRAAGVKGDLESGDALAWLRGLVHVIQAAGFKGLVICVDELETVLRARGDVRARSYNALRQIIDAAPNMPGVFWLFTGTPTLFDAEGRGIASLPPLHDRIRFQKHNDAASPRQPQVELRPFDAERLTAVLKKLRAIYPTQNRGRLESVLTDAVIDRFVAKHTEGLQGEYGVIPRVALRTWVEWMDLAETRPGWVP